MRNDSPRTALVTRHAPRIAAPGFEQAVDEDIVLPPGGNRDVSVYLRRPVREWVACAEWFRAGKGDSDGWPHFFPLGSYVGFSYRSPGDSGVDDHFPFTYRESPLEPVPDQSGAWRIRRESEGPSSAAMDIVQRHRTYFLSRSENDLLL